MKDQVYRELLKKRAEKRAGLLVLLDPDRSSPDSREVRELVSTDGPADFVLVGTSLQFNDSLDDWLRRLRAHCTRPVIIFPGSIRQLSRYADAVLFISLLSGRNAEYLIGQQVHGAPLVRSLQVEPIGTGYVVIESGRASATELVTGTNPLPAERNDLAVAHALAAEYLGMKLVYLDAGSGAERHVPVGMVREVSGAIDVPLVVGGGIASPRQAAELVRSGADFLVVGNALEKSGGIELAREISSAIQHAANQIEAERIEYARR